ncbi:MAG: fused response regulator/phosphatase [Phycisphaerales bacterium]
MSSTVRENLPAVSVLLVDDQAIIGEAVRRMLAPHADIAYRFLADPTKAVQTAIELKPTVILQDLVMPAVDGLDLVSQYRATEELKETPIVVLSSKEEATTKAEAFARGANDYLVKLPDPIEIIARIRHHSRGYVAQLERNEAFRQLAASEAHMAAELKKAAQYVQSLLDPPVDRAELRTEWAFIPSASLGGDSFGYHWIDKDNFACYVLDVCGHGVGPALLSVSALSLIRSLPTEEQLDPKTVLERLNTNFPMTRHNGMFFTIWYGVFDRRTRVLTWSGGGHPPALVQRGDTLSELESQGLMIGVAPELGNPNDRMELTPGDRLLLYTDGVFEIMQPNGTIWGLPHLLDALRGVKSGSRVDFVRDLTRSVQGHENYLDDYSIIEIEIR